MERDCKNTEKCVGEAHVIKDGSGIEAFHPQNSPGRVFEQYEETADRFEARLQDLSEHLDRDREG